MGVGPSLGCRMAGHLLSPVPAFPTPQPGLQRLVPPLLGEASGPEP